MAVRLSLFGVYPTITLADARSLRDEARKLVAEGKNPSEVRKEQKLALQTESENAFEKIARAWHQLKSAKWSAGYVSDIMEAFKNDIFLMSEQGQWGRLNR